MTEENAVKGNGLVNDRRQAERLLSSFANDRNNAIYADQRTRDSDAIRHLLGNGGEDSLSPETMGALAAIAQAGLEAAIVRINAELEAL